LVSIRDFVYRDLSCQNCGKAKASVKEPSSITISNYRGRVINRSGWENLVLRIMISQPETREGIKMRKKQIFVSGLKSQ